MLIYLQTTAGKGDECGLFTTRSSCQIACRERRGFPQALGVAVLGPSPSLCFPVNGSLVVRATVTHSEATEKYNPSPEVGGKNIGS